MFPTRRPGRSSHESPFARTFISSTSPLQCTRVPGSSSRQQTPSSSGEGMTTVVRPGEPHYFGVRLDRQRALALGNLCRCQNPESHGDAWSVDEPASDMDIHGNWLSWKEVSNRVLDHYGKLTVTRKEEYESYRHLLHPADYRSRMRSYHQLNRHVGLGFPVYCGPSANRLQFHGGDGHIREHVTENGIRTMVNRPRGLAEQGPYGGPFGGPRVSRC